MTELHEVQASIRSAKSSVYQRSVDKRDKLRMNDTTTFDRALVARDYNRCKQLISFFEHVELNTTYKNSASCSKQFAMTVNENNIARYRECIVTHAELNIACYHVFSRNSTIQEISRNRACYCNIDAKTFTVTERCADAFDARTYSFRDLKYFTARGISMHLTDTLHVQQAQIADVSRETSESAENALVVHSARAIANTVLVSRALAERTSAYDAELKAEKAAKAAKVKAKRAKNFAKNAVIDVVAE